jgi:hypothetical protein
MMDKYILRIFQHEVERQCRFAIMAAQDLQASLQAHDMNVRDRMDRIWYSIQSFLIAAGNVSKLLWPSRPEIAERADELKKSLGVDENSPLAPRTFRNHFEHFDERLERWALSSKTRNFVDSNVGPAGMISGMDPKDYLRNFDPGKGAVTYRGDEYLLKPITEAIIELHKKALAETNKKH